MNMNANTKMLIASIMGLSLINAPILSNAATSSISVNAVSSATTKQPVQNTTKPTTTTTVKPATQSTTKPTTTQTPKTTTPTKTTKLWTKEKVKAYNGKSGKPTYIIVNGAIYDVTKVQNWKNGMHNVSAGTDVTTAFIKIPNYAKVLKKFKLVAKIGDPVFEPNVSVNTATAIKKTTSTKPSVADTSKSNTIKEDQDDDHAKNDDDADHD